MVQNSGLTGELEYQSKQAESLIYKQQAMQRVIKQLTVELQDHALVETELATKSHLCHKAILKYHLVIKKLKGDINDLTLKVVKDGDKDDSELRVFLTQRIQRAEASLKQSQTNLKQQQAEFDLLVTRVQTVRQKY